jgi:hypothetical protein
MQDGSSDRRRWELVESELREFATRQKRGVVELCRYEFVGIGPGSEAWFMAWYRYLATRARSSGVDTLFEDLDTTELGATEWVGDWIYVQLPSRFALTESERGTGFQDEAKDS